MAPNATNAKPGNTGSGNFPTAAGARRLSLWTDAAVVVAATVIAQLFCIHYEFAEALRRLTRPYESIQLDELPVVLLVTAIAMIWFGWRRYTEARDELARRLAVEDSLNAALGDNRRLIQHQVDAQEAERRRIARELHDELSQYLNAIKLDAVAADVPATPAALRQRARCIIDSIDHVHHTVQALIRRFRPLALDELGLAAALEHCVDEWRRRLPDTQVTLRIDGNVDHYDETLNLTLYRLVQEALTNISRHAHARHADVYLRERANLETARRTGEWVGLTVSDDGVGMVQDGRPHGLGLLGIRERVSTLSGSLVIDSSPGHGFTLDVRLPSNAGAAA